MELSQKPFKRPMFDKYHVCWVTKPAFQFIFTYEYPAKESISTSVIARQSDKGMILPVEIYEGIYSSDPDSSFSQKTFVNNIEAVCQHWNSARIEGYFPKCIEITSGLLRGTKCLATIAPKGSSSWWRLLTQYPNY